MKRGFTLVEIVITLVIIGLILALVSGMGQGFSDRVRFANAKEELRETVNDVIQEAATTNAVFVGSGVRQRYGSITLTFLSGSEVQRTYASGELASDIVRTKTISSHGIITTSGFMLRLSSYAVGCDVLSGDTFAIHSAENPVRRACYTTDASTCKVREIICAP